MTQARNWQSKEYNGLKVAADWIEDLEGSDSRLHKETVLAKALVAARLGSAGAQCFLYNCYLAYNPYFVYGVKQVPETKGLNGKPNPWTEFWALTEALRTRSITGNRAKDKIQELANRFDSLEWNGLARRVLIKDLRCGISEKSLNKVLGNSEWKIPVFNCQLAQDSGDHPAHMKGSKRIECKLDGVRVLAIVSGHTVNLCSRNGKPFDNFPQVAEAIEAHRDVFNNALNAAGRFVLDGEIVGESFQKLMRQAHRKSNVKTTGMVYHIFDIIPLDEFERGHWNKQQHQRLAILDLVDQVLKQQTDCLRIMPGLTVNLNTTKGHDVMNRFAQDAVKTGYEGIMIKSMEAPYECKRSNFWMKWKPTITVDLDIVGFEEGTGRNQGRLGAIICEGVDNGRNIRVNVGSGLSDSDRDQYWISRNDLLGRVVEIQADAITQNQNGSYSLRFPRFLRFRGWEAGEKL